MHTLIIDTCTWINLSTEIYSPVLLDKIESLISAKRIRLILPRLVATEWNRHKATKIEGRKKSILDRFRHIKELKPLIADAEYRTIESILDKCKADEAKITDFATRSAARIDQIFAGIDPLGYNYEDIMDANDRALAKQAPFVHRNSQADALILISSLRYARGNRLEPVFFITDNKDDFSDPERKDSIHPDLVDLLQESHCSYYLNLGQALNAIESNAISQSVVEAVSKAQEYPACFRCGNEMSIQGWRHSQFGGGVSWHYICPNCGAGFDTGNFFD